MIQAWDNKIYNIHEGLNNKLNTYQSALFSADLETYKDGLQKAIWWDLGELILKNQWTTYHKINKNLIQTRYISPFSKVIARG